MSTIFLPTLYVFTVIVFLLILTSFFFYRLSISRGKKVFLKGNPDLKADHLDHIGNLWKTDSQWLEQQPLEDIDIKSEDGLNLHGYYLGAKIPTNRTVILAHGYTSKGMDNGCFAKLYHEILGFNVLMPDDRGHGQSDGSYIGFGWPDRKDYLKWIDIAIERSGKDSQIVLHGISMGGATVLMTGGEDLPDNVKCIISDCSYTSAKDILSYHLKRMFKLPRFPLMPITSLVCKARAGYYLGEASALDQVGKIKKPVLFIHGGEDTFVPTEMVMPLYEKCSSDKELLLVPKAGHGLAYYTDTEGYSQKTADFINKHVK